MSFTNPSAFFLLLLLPIFIRLGWPRLAYRRRRDMAALVIRLVLVLLLILSLAGLEIRRPADNLAVVFLVDVSDSMDDVSQRQALEFVRASIDEMANQDRAAVILFGSNALVEHPMDELINLNRIGSNPIRINTDMAEAIRLGLALFPPDAAKRMVVLSDGLETTGDALRAAELAAATGVQIEYVPFGIPRDKEVLVSSVSVPAVVGEDEPFDLIISIENKGTEVMPANVFVFAGGQTIHEASVDLYPGDNRYAVGPIQYPVARFLDFQVKIEPQTAEGFKQNNQLSAFTQVSGRPCVLVVANDPAETQYLENALNEAGLLTDVVTPDNMPLGLAPLVTYKSIILANVPAADLTPTRMELLQTYVKDLGRGLVAIGGPESYGVGGYFQTPLEETLPVDMRIKDEERIPKLTMVYVIDRSGSMEMSGPSGFTNLELAKEAVLRSLDFLNDYDRAGVVSFDTQAFWVFEIQEVGDSASRQALEDEIGSLRSGGGTDIFGGLSAVDRALPNDPSTLKHVILLTDGGANPGGIIPLVQRLRSNYDITTSVVAIGEDYAPFLRDVASYGGGNFHISTTVESIPSIFSAETVLATRSYIFEDPFVPTLVSNSPILDGLDLSAVPQLLGYVATTPKDTATVIFTGPEDDPILASWQYGLGRSVAFMSDATLRWGAQWVSWSQYTRFWNQVVRWTITEGTTNNLDTWVEQRGEEAVLVVDARDNDGNYLNGLELESSIVGPPPDYTSVALDFQQVAPGRYEAAFAPTMEGAYHIGVFGQTPEGAPVQATIGQNTGWVLSYSSEYSVSQPDVQLLRAIAGKTGGDTLAGDPAGAFIHNLDQEEAARPLWPFLLGAAAFLLVMDIAVRRLVINKSDLQRLRERFLVRREADYEVSERSEQLGGLMRAKDRAKEQTATSDNAPSVSPPPAAPPPPKPEPKAEAPKPRAKPKSAPPPATDGNMASRLLQKKREREE
ncbi:MAG: VWA domain-containing protein [Anaerolineales bacterium]|nr:VWA domain-containing protein [Anaerolineales bacterium]